MNTIKLDDGSILFVDHIVSIAYAQPVKAKKAKYSTGKGSSQMVAPAVKAIKGFHIACMNGGHRLKLSAKDVSKINKAIK